MVTKSEVTCPRCGSSKIKVVAASTDGLKLSYKAICRDCGLRFSSSGHTVVITGTDITLPGTVDGVDLSSHAANASAHHTKTTDAGDITSGRFGVTRFGWTADKFLKGAGLDANPTEVGFGTTAGTIAEGNHTHTITITELLKGGTRKSLYPNSGWEDTASSATVPSSAKKVYLVVRPTGENYYCEGRMVYNGVVRCTQVCSYSADYDTDYGGYAAASWIGDGAGVSATAKLQMRNTDPDYVQDHISQAVIAYASIS